MEPAADALPGKGKGKKGRGKERGDKKTGPKGWKNLEQALDAKEKPGAFYQRHKGIGRDVEPRRNKEGEEEEPCCGRQHELPVREPFSDMVFKQENDQCRKKEDVIEVGQEKQALAGHNEESRNAIAHEGECLEKIHEDIRREQSFFVAFQHEPGKKGEKTEPEGGDQPGPL